MNYCHQNLDLLARQFRRDVIDTLYKTQSGHPGGSMSVTEILIAIYFLHARIDPDNPNWKERDRIVLCKGHAVPMLYRVLAGKGFFDVAECSSLRQCGSRFPGHPSAKTTPGIDIASGPLGLGYSAAVGMALAQRLDRIDAYTYAILGEGDVNEGVFWEGLMSAVKFKVNNVVAILDNNGIQLDGTCQDVMPLCDLPRRFESFGAKTIMVDGHNILAISHAIKCAKNTKDCPTIIIAKTIKGRGISFMENTSEWHGKQIGDKEYQQAMTELSY